MTTQRIADLEAELQALKAQDYVAGRASGLNRQGEGPVLDGAVFQTFTVETDDGRTIQMTPVPSTMNKPSQDLELPQGGRDPGRAGGRPPVRMVLGHLRPVQPQ